VSVSATIPSKYVPTFLRHSVQVALTPGLGLSPGLLALGSSSESASMHGTCVQISRVNGGRACAP
jgi:hypothetical protein